MFRTLVATRRSLDPVHRFLGVAALSAGLSWPALGLTGCESSEPTTVAVRNGHARSSTTIHKVWYRTALFVEPLAPGQQSSTHDMVKGSDHAYALVGSARGGDGGPPEVLFAVRTTGPIEVERGELKVIELSEASTQGMCSGLSREAYEEIRLRYFPGDPVAPFDPARCSPAPSVD